MDREIVTKDNFKAGRRVVRSNDWIFDNQDYYKGKQSSGVLLSTGTSPGWAMVRWKSRRVDAYRIGGSWEGALGFDLRYLDYDIIEVLKIFDKLK